MSQVISLVHSLLLMVEVHCLKTMSMEQMNKRIEGTCPFPLFFMIMKVVEY